jgi:hypothetical protein
MIEIHQALLQLLFSTSQELHLKTDNLWVFLALGPW